MALGILELALVALCLTPRTAPAGAVLWTGYLGAAVGLHARADPLAGGLAPVAIAALLWLPLYVRDARVRALL